MSGLTQEPIVEKIYSTGNLPQPFGKLMAASTVEWPLSFDKLRMVSLVEPFAKSRETRDSLL